MTVGNRSGLAPGFGIREPRRPAVRVVLDRQAGRKRHRLVAEAAGLELVRRRRLEQFVALLLQHRACSSRRVPRTARDSVHVKPLAAAGVVRRQVDRRRIKSARPTSPRLGQQTQKRVPGVPKVPVVPGLVPVPRVAVPRVPVLGFLRRRWSRSRERLWCLRLARRQSTAPGRRPYPSTSAPRNASAFSTPPYYRTHPDESPISPLLRSPTSTGCSSSSRRSLPSNRRAMTPSPSTAAEPSWRRGSRALAGRSTA